jgi:hypothetical protein
MHGECARGRTWASLMRFRSNSSCALSTHGSVLASAFFRMQMFKSCQQDATLACIVLIVGRKSPNHSTWVHLHIKGRIFAISKSAACGEASICR